MTEYEVGDRLRFTGFVQGEDYEDLPMYAVERDAEIIAGPDRNGDYDVQFGDGLVGWFSDYELRHDFELVAHA